MARARSAKKTKAEQRAETIEEILDAAELLFSKHGLYGVTLRDVAEKVGVHTSLLHYYFKDKTDLFESVLSRRAGVTRDRRMRALDQYEKESKGKPTVEGALHAFLDTDLDLYSTSGPGWRHYGKFGAQLSNTEFGADSMVRNFDPLVLRLLDILKRALPGAADVDMFWGYHFVTGALMLTLARTGRIDQLSHGLCKSDDFAAVKARMAKFMAAGFISICEKKKKR
jgi:AcrR family transcriptional regulator